MLCSLIAGVMSAVVVDALSVCDAHGFELLRRVLLAAHAHYYGICGMPAVQCADAAHKVWHTYGAETE